MSLPREAREATGRRSTEAFGRSPAVAAALLALAACRGGNEAAGTQEEATRAPETASSRNIDAGGGRYHGAVLEPGARPDFTLTDVDGRDFRFREETEGQLALLFFGYTNCPDVCPVHMAGIAAVLQDLPWEIRDRIRVVFVSTDPERDTPQRLREWLAGFDRRFVGLRGDIEEVNRIQAELGLPTAVRLADPPDEDGGGAYEVGHAAQVLVFGAGQLRLAYPFGTRQSDWTEDLPLLVSELPPAGDGRDTASAPDAPAGE